MKIYFIKGENMDDNKLKIATVEIGKDNKHDSVDVHEYYYPLDKHNEIHCKFYDNPDEKSPMCYMTIIFLNKTEIERKSFNHFVNIQNWLDGYKKCFEETQKELNNAFLPIIKELDKL
jgi:hypothetical protein